LGGQAKVKTTINLDNKKILVTGCPGFIGANLVIRLLKSLSSGMIVSLDNMNDYYDPGLKEYRLKRKRFIQTRVRRFLNHKTLASFR